MRHELRDAMCRREAADATADDGNAARRSKIDDAVRMISDRQASDRVKVSIAIYQSPLPDVAAGVPGPVGFAVGRRSGIRGRN